MELFFGSDLLEGSNIRARTLGGIKLLCALRQRRDALMEKSYSFFSFFHRLRFRLPVERGIKEWFFHDEDDPHHVCGWQGREQLQSGESGQPIGSEIQ